MNKKEMAEKLGKQAGLSVAKALEIIDMLFATKGTDGIIATELAAGKKVSIAGFGVFSTSVRKARVGRNPQTGAPIQIPERTAPVFKAGKGLKERV